MINVSTNMTYKITDEEYKQHRIEMHKLYIESLYLRIATWQNKKGYSAKMDAWCDKNIKELKKKLLEEGESDVSI